jgi:hypothetical protein
VYGRNIIPGNISDCMLVYKSNTHINHTHTYIYTYIHTHSYGRVHIRASHVGMDATSFMETFPTLCMYINQIHTYIHEHTVCMYINQIHTYIHTHSYGRVHIRASHVGMDATSFMETFQTDPEVAKNKAIWKEKIAGRHVVLG